MRHWLPNGYDLENLIYVINTHKEEKVCNAIFEDSLNRILVAARAEQQRQMLPWWRRWLGLV